MLKELHELTSDETLSFEQKTRAILKLGLEEFQQDHGIVSFISDDTYTIKYVVSDDPGLKPDLTFPVGETYCWHTLQADNAIAFSHAGTIDSVATHPCYKNLGLESYIGARITVMGELYGTLNFSSASPRPEPFTSEHIDFINLFAQWIGVELSRVIEQQKLKQRIELQQQMEEMALIGGWEVDLENNHIFWTEQTRRIHEVPDDYEPDLATAIEFYVEGESRDAISDALAEAMATGTPWSLEVLIRTYTGNLKWVATQGRTEFKDGQCVRILGAFQDIDAQVSLRNELIEKRNEAERLLKARSAMIGKISHELRTPINGIAGMLQTLVGESNQDIIESRVAIAMRSADLLVRLVNDVLDYSKVESGQLELEDVAYSPKNIFDDLYYLYEPLARKKGIEMTVEAKIPDGLRALGDPGRMTQIYSNLINNAVKFTDKGKVSLTARVKEKDDQNMLSVTVTDTGIGMSEQAIESLYQPFKQGNAGISSKYGGSGLGFAIVKELCDAFGGTQKVSSREGVGTRIVIELPLKPLNQEEMAQEDYIGPENSSFEHIKLLVVDDNEINRLVMESLLSQLQISADYAVNGLEALNCIERASEPYTLVLMDCEMPVMDGIEATQVIKDTYTNNSKMFIVAMTADTSDLNRQACLKAGMDAFLSKPIKLDALRSVLNEVAFPQITAASFTGQR